MSASCRYEILLPLRFNDGQDVPESLLVEVVLELRLKFHAVTSETQIIQGLWESEGVIFRDELMRIFVDVPDTSEKRQFFVQFKEQLKSASANSTFGSPLMGLT